MRESFAPVDEMYVEGLEMKRAQFRRVHHGATDAMIEQLLRDWILDRPMDAPGPVRPS